MAWGSGTRVIFILYGLFVVIAAIYTIRNPKRELRRGLQFRNVDRKTIIRQKNDPKRIQETRRYAWFGLLIGLVIIGAALAPSDDLRLLIVSFNLLLPLLYVVATPPICEDAPRMIIIIFTFGGGLLVAGSLIPEELQEPLVFVVGMVVLLLLLAVNPLGYGSKYAHKTFHYQCIRCEQEFETSIVNMAEATCPDCGATQLATVVPER